MTKYFSLIHKYLINQQSTQYSGMFVCIGNHILSNKAKVTLILHTARSKNDMNMDKCIKRSIIWSPKFIV